MYALGFDEKYENKESIQYNVEKALLRAVDVILDSAQKLPIKGQYQALGMPFGIGYLLVECKDDPTLPKPSYGSSFGKMKKVSYGMGVADLVTESNAYLKTLDRKHLRSAL